MPESDTHFHISDRELSKDGYTHNSLIRLVRAGSEYFDLLEKLCDEATHTIHFQTYIFQSDETGIRIWKALLRAARRNVKVFMVVDGYASQELPDEFIFKLKENGVYFRFFSPLIKSKLFYFGRRLHHKVVVVDGRKSLVGGINIGNHYNDTTENVAWLDWALYSEGPVGRELQRICEVRLKSSFVKAMIRATKPLSIKDDIGSDGYLVRPRINDWVRSRNEVTKSYQEMLTRAKSHVIIMSSYFLPGKIMKRYLRNATRRGVRVTVIVAGFSDVILAKNAERYMYWWLLKNNIEIYEYQRKVLHAKLATYDGKWVTVGSYNVNNISAYASVELNMDVMDEGFALDVEKRIDRIIKTDCIRISEEVYLKNQTLWNRYLQRSAYDIFKLLLFVFTFYFKQRN